LEALIGVVVGGILIILGGHFSSKSADRRLKMQLDREDQRRQQDRIIKAQLESIDNLRILIETMTSAMPVIASHTLVSDEIMVPVLRDIQRATVSMAAVQDESAVDGIQKVHSAIVTVMDNAGGDVVPGIKNLTLALASLERRYNELKAKAIRAS